MSSKKFHDDETHQISSNSRFLLKYPDTAIFTIELISTLNLKFDNCCHFLIANVLFMLSTITENAITPSTTE